MSAVIEPEVIAPNSLVTTSRVAAFYGGLTSRQSAFIDRYLVSGNGAKAALEAGYGSTVDIAAVRASQLLRTSKIQSEIKRRLGTSIASSTEVLETLSKHARADITDILDTDGQFNLKLAKSRRILKKLKIKTRYEKDFEGNLQPVVEHEYEIHDPQSALDKLARFHGLYSDSEHKAPTINLQADSITVVLQSVLNELNVTD